METVVWGRRWRDCSFLSIIVDPPERKQEKERESAKRGAVDV